MSITNREAFNRFMLKVPNEIIGKTLSPSETYGCTNCPKKEECEDEKNFGVSCDQMITDWLNDENPSNQERLKAQLELMCNAENLKPVKPRYVISREAAACIIDIFEDYLDKKCIHIENKERDEQVPENDANLWGEEFDNLINSISESLAHSGVIIPDTYEWPEDL